MKRRLRPDEARLWRGVAQTLVLAPGAALPPDPDLIAAPPPVSPQAPEPKGPRPPAKRIKPAAKSPALATAKPRTAPPKPAAPPQAIEPGRKRRIARERDPIEARLDLHGMDQDRARAALHSFILRASDQGFRAVLIITGKGNLGDGILRTRTPDWLAEAPVRERVAGYALAERHHGGAGALYVALKRRS